MFGTECAYFLVAPMRFVELLRVCIRNCKSVRLHILHKEIVLITKVFSVVTDKKDRRYQLHAFLRNEK